jgi:hypothetical protein
MELTGQMDAPARRKQMKKTLIAIAFAAASLPLTFAAQTNQPAPAAKSDTAMTAKTTKTTKAKKAKKAKKSTATTTATPSTPKQ